MEDDTKTSGKWSQGNINGMNGRLVKIAENLAKLQTEVLQKKIEDLKGVVNANAHKSDHPDFQKFVESVNNLDVRLGPRKTGSEG